MTSMAIFIFLMVMARLEVPVAGQGPTLAPAPASALGPPITCSLPTNTSMISPNYCNTYDEQGMNKQTAVCQGFLTMFEDAPSKDCCFGLNNVAYNRTACICKLTFYPPAAHNASRQQDLPRLCGVRTNLCGQCPMFLVSLSQANGTVPSPGISNVPYSDGKSTASTVGAISLAVVFGMLLLAGIVGFSLMLLKKRREKNNPPEPFQAPPPGGVF